MNSNSRNFAGGQPWFVAVILFLWVMTGIEARSQNVSPDLKRETTSQSDQPARSWQLGGFAAGGFVPFYDIHSPGYHYALQLDFVNAGFDIGRMLTPPCGPGILRGKAEGILEVMPFWLAYYPAQTRHAYYLGSTVPVYAPWGSYSRFGASVTPVLFRWNFVRSEGSRSLPWMQLGGGLLWTNHKFPLLGGSTSVINFTPQVGIGESIFIRKRRSLDFAIKAVHISNAGLGDNNPGINATLQFSMGYSWWR